MRQFLLLCIPIVLSAAMTGCGVGGPKPGLPDEVSVGAPPLPPGTSNEMAGDLKKPRNQKPAQP